MRLSNTATDYEWHIPKTSYPTPSNHVAENSIEFLDNRLTQHLLEVLPRLHSRFGNLSGEVREINSLPLV